jgi:predicted PurR-regulated permease PerM
MRAGIARMIEAVISAILIIGAFSVSYYLLIPPSASQIRSGESLTKYGYNLLSTLASSNGFERLFIDYHGERVSDWEQQLKSTLNSLLPSNVLFNLTVYKAMEVQGGNGFVSLIVLNKVPISNVGDPRSFIDAGETAQITYVYTMKNMTILVFNLRLADIGGA